MLCLTGLKLSVDTWKEKEVTNVKTVFEISGTASHTTNWLHVIASLVTNKLLTVTTSLWINHALLQVLSWISFMLKFLVSKMFITKIVTLHRIYIYIIKSICLFINVLLIWGIKKMRGKIISDTVNCSWLGFQQVSICNKWTSTPVAHAKSHNTLRVCVHHWQALLNMVMDLWVP